jgi:hypothetical protein
MIRTLALACCLALILAGCQTNGERAWSACEPIKDSAAWSECFDRHMPSRQRSTYDDRPSSRDADDAAALLLLGGMAFMSGWNQGRDQVAPRQSTCQWIAGMLQCTSW